jgi:hypothetical protein
MIARPATACLTASVGLLSALGPVWAERVDCTFAAPCPANSGCTPAPLTLHFDIDPNQFAPAIDANEPPRTKITQVTEGDETFAAEPILMDSGVRGFWTDQDGSARILTVQPDGAAVYTRTAPNLPDGEKRTGQCGVSQ